MFTEHCDNKLSWNFLGGIEKQDKTSVRVARVSVEIRPGPRPNSRIEVLQLFPPHGHLKIFGRQDFASTVGKDYNHAATNFNGVINIRFIL